MKKIFFSLIFCSPVFGFSQQCKDSLRQPDKYHNIDYHYIPLCGCDGHTYRNSDAAYWWGGIDTYNPDGPCEDFDIDLYPNMISTDPSNMPELRIYMKFPGTATVTIYSSMGRLLFEKLFSNDQSFGLIHNADPYYLKEAQTFPRDVYLLVVTVNGIRKSLKFIKVDNGK